MYFKISSSIRPPELTVPCGLTMHLFMQDMQSFFNSIHQGMKSSGIPVSEVSSQSKGVGMVLVPQ